MRVVNFSEARSNLKNVINMCDTAQTARAG